MTSVATPAPVSTVPPPVDAHLDLAVSILTGRRIAVLTGAGVSTDSGIPDYRGAGALPRNPMTFQQFVADAEYRKRYWAGSQLGWRHFSLARPNIGHATLAELETDGIVTGVVTQNVDGLHLQAGSRKVVDLHGTMDTVRCLVCTQSFARSDISARIAADNPWISQIDDSEINPDGDASISAFSDFVTPDCTVCGGILKPNVVFFGELVPTEKFGEATALVAKAGALIVAGSSLAVNSGIRLIEQARRRKIPIIVINRGITKGDSRAAVKIDAGTSETLVLLKQRLTR
jgi:NAD-dependent SIR2 family protein deacetylase